MARISYLLPEDVKDAEMYGWLTTAMAMKTPGPENQAIRAHNKTVMRNFTQLIYSMEEEGVLEYDLRELMRARIATSWAWMFRSECHY